MQEKSTLVNTSGRLDEHLKYKSNIWKLYLFTILLNFHFISGILLPFFLEWGGLNFFQVMLLQGFFTSMIFVFEIPCGAISDYLSRRFSLILSALVTAIAVFIYGSTPHIIAFIIGETLWGLGGALLSGTNQALIYDTLRKLDRTRDIKKIMARNQSMMLVGILISAPIGSMFALTIPLNVIMQLMAIPFLLAMVTALTFKEPNEELVPTQSESYIEIIRSGFQDLRNIKTLRILAIDAIIGDIIAFYLIWMYQVYLESLGISIVLFGFVAAGMTISQMTLTTALPEIEQKFANKKRFLKIYTIIPALGFITMAFFYAPILGVILILITIGFGMSRKFIFTHAINNVIESENRATVLSTISMFECMLRGALFPLIGILVMLNLNITFLILGSGLILLALTSRVKDEHLT